MGGGGIVQIRNDCGSLVGGVVAPWRVSDGCPNVILGIALTLAGILLAERSYDEYKDATDKLRDIADRQLNIAETLQDHWTDTQYPQLTFAIDGALGMTVPEPNIGEANSKSTIDAQTVKGGAGRSVQALRKEWGIPGIQSCYRGLEMAEAIASVDTGYAIIAAQDRQYERRLEMKTQNILRAHGATMINVSPLFGLLNNAATVYGSIQQQAGQQLNSSIAITSLGIGEISNWLKT